MMYSWHRMILLTLQRLTQMDYMIMDSEEMR